MRPRRRRAAWAVAARAGGVSLLSLVTPVIVFSLLMSGLCALINLEIAPRCRTAYKQLVYDLAKTNPSALLSDYAESCSNVARASKALH